MSLHTSLYCGTVGGQVNAVTFPLGPRLRGEFPTSAPVSVLTHSRDDYQPTGRSGVAQAGIMALWHYGIRALWHYGTMALWHYGAGALWHYGIMACVWLTTLVRLVFSTSRSALSSLSLSGWLAGWPAGLRGLPSLRDLRHGHVGPIIPNTSHLLDWLACWQAGRLSPAERCAVALSLSCRSPVSTWGRLYWIHAGRLACWPALTLRWSTLVEVGAVLDSLSQMILCAWWPIVSSTTIRLVCWPAGCRIFYHTAP